MFFGREVRSAPLVRNNQRFASTRFWRSAAFRVQGSGFRVLGLATGVGEWFRVQGSGFRVLGLATGVGILVQSSVFLVSCSGFSDRDRNAVP